MSGSLENVGNRDWESTCLEICNYFVGRKFTRFTTVCTYLQFDDIQIL